MAPDRRHPHAAISGDKKATAHPRDAIAKEES
jgi:hypothetical protein